MRTRRSWRNQDRLWRALGAPGPAPQRRDEVAVIVAMLDHPALNARDRRKLERDLLRAKQRALLRRRRDRG